MTLKNCEAIPKRYTFFGVAHTYELAQEVLDFCIKANNLNVTTSFEARRAFLEQALCSLACLSNQLQLLMLYADLPDKKWLLWGSKITLCEKLIRGILKSDKERAKK